MGLLEGIFYMLWRGFAIGVIISAPMGPVGILCVQRTLEKGRRTGFYTGVGAALSDLIYCLITGFGLSFVEEFLKSNQDVIQLIGSVVLAVFGVYLFRSNPSKTLRKPDSNDSSPQKDILSGFLFTFSNPLIVFLIIGLFARFNFLLPEITWYDYIIGFLSVIVGALSWWWIVTFAINKVRAHFNLRSMWLINKIIGGVIMIFAIVGAFTAISGMATAKAENLQPLFLNSTRGFGSLAPAGEKLRIENKTLDTLKVTLPGAGAGLSSLTFRCRNLNNMAGRRYSFEDEQGRRHSVSHPGWGIWFAGEDRDTVNLFFNTADDVRDAFANPSLEITTVPYIADPKSIDSGLDFFTDPNSFQIDFSPTGFMLNGGNREHRPLLGPVDLDFEIASAGFAVEPGGAIEIDHIVMKVAGSSDIPAYEDIIGLMERLRQSADPHEGVWEEFDRMIDESKLRSGGRYRLAIAERPGGYDIIYLSGAVKNSGEWEEGALKGKLESTSFKGIYSLTWLDSEGKPLPGEGKAQFDSDMLTMNFPYLDSQIRLRRVR